MKITIFKKTGTIAMIILVVIFIVIVAKPVLPSKYILMGMADAVDVKTIPWDDKIVVHYELYGKGGGRYNLIADREKAVITEGEPDRIDLYFKMEASEFNDLMIAMARGMADESMFKCLVIANKLKFAGDISVMEKLFSEEGGK